MKLTNEQQNILGSSGDIKINAVAGSGKTTTIIEYARSRPSGSRILYLAFNRSVKTEALKKFAEAGLRNVQVETAHSLAFKHIVPRSGYKVRSQPYKTYEVAELLGLNNNGEKHAEHIIATHISKFMAYFCNSDKQKVQELNYLDTVSDTKARTFVANFYGYIEQQTRIFLARMDKAEIEVTHDFYLKKFQLSKPRLVFDHILFDEAQDASAAMLDVVFTQTALKVIVGDTHQQIYGWRYAVNSLEKAGFTPFTLSASFRFRNDIAGLACEILHLKNILGNTPQVIISGLGKSDKKKSKATLGRTNLGLLLKAIEYVTAEKKASRIYFEGNISSYTYAEDGASLYDVLNLYNGKKHLIKDRLVKEMNSLDELEEYIEKTEDVQLGMMVEIVKEYGNDIPDIIKTIKERHVANDEKEKAAMVFSTVHRCKGMEYDVVELVEDFITEEKLKNTDLSKMTPFEKTRLIEEVNLLYVAVTRAKNKLIIPENLLPASLRKAMPGGSITILPKPGTTTTGNYMEERRAKKEAHKHWTDNDDKELAIMYCEGIDIAEMAKHFGRTKGVIWSRIKKLDLEDLYG